MSKKNIYIDISESSIEEIRLLLAYLKDRYFFEKINARLVDELAQNRFTMVLDGAEKICYLENERYDNSMTILEFKKNKLYN